MNLKKYRLFKIMALSMAFVWLIGTYATGMTGVHATDDFDYTGSVDDNNGGEYLEEPVVGTIGVVPLSVWSPTPVLERRDWTNSGDLSDDSRLPVLFNVSRLEGSWMTFADIHEAFFGCIVRRGHTNSSTVHPIDEDDRRAAFRVFHFHQGTLTYLNMCQHNDTATLDGQPNRSWGSGNFQYAYVQMLYFNTNFEHNGVHTENILGEWTSRMVIMGSHYDRMFVNSIPPFLPCYGSGYGTLRNYLFPRSPACQVLPPAGGVNQGFDNLVHPRGYIFGGWFDVYYHGDQTERIRERTGPVTTQPIRTLYARWYKPTIDKVVNPTEITPEQIIAGTPVTYTITIDTVNMPANLINFTVTDPLDSRLTFLPDSVNITPSPGTGAAQPSIVNGVLTFDISDFAGEDPIGDIVITFQATVNPGATGTIENIAYLYGPPGTGPSGGDGPITQSPPAELEILPDGSITVIVVDDDGNPVPGANVNLYDDEGNRIRTGVTGENGRVVFPHLPDGEYRVVVTHPDHPGWTQEREVEIVDASDEVVIVVIPGPPPYQYPIECDCECDCPECDCPDCDCPDCDCVECECQCDCPPPTTRGRPAGAGRGAPRTGDFSSVTPFLASILLSMSAIFGGIELKRRFKK